MRYHQLEQKLEENSIHDEVGDNYQLNLKIELIQGQKDQLLEHFYFRLGLK